MNSEQDTDERSDEVSRIRQTLIPWFGDPPWKGFAVAVILYHVFGAMFYALLRVIV